jgi:hypothetical protein
MIAGSFEPWFGKTVVLRLITGETRVPLCGIIVAESGGAIRLRIEGGWDIDVYKSLILAAERERGHTSSRRGTEIHIEDSREGNKEECEAKMSTDLKRGLTI